MNNPRRWLGLAVIGIAVSLIIVDTTIVNVAIPSIVDDLGLSSTQVQWVQEAYTLVFAALLIPFGTLADRVGRRRILMIGVAVFTLASIMAGLSGSGGALIAARVAQGIGGAMVLPGTMSLINATFRGKERTIAFAVWGSIIGGMAAIGPLLGGWLITDFSWRWAFGVNVPFGILVLAGAIYAIQESKSHNPGHLDIAGAALVVVAAGSLVFSLIEGRTMGWWATNHAPSVGGWTWPYDIAPTPFTLLLAVVAGGLFIAMETRRKRRGEATMLPLDLFAIRSFSGGNLVAMIVSLGELGILFVLPLWVQNVLHYDALQTGLILLPLAIGSFLATGMVSGLARRMTPLGMLRLGVLLELLGVFALALVLRPDTSWQPIAGMLFVYGLGLGLASSQVTNVVLADVPVDESGQGSGMQTTSRQIGSALGVAILGTVLFTTLASNLDSQLGDLDGATRTQFVNAVTDSAGAAIPGLLANPATADVGTAAAESFTTAASSSAYTAAGFLGLALATSFVLGSAKRSEDSEPELDDETADV